MQILLLMVLGFIPYLAGAKGEYPGYPNYPSFSDGTSKQLTLSESERLADPSVVNKDDEKAFLIPSTPPKELSSKDQKIWESLNQKRHLNRARMDSWKVRVKKARDTMLQMNSRYFHNTPQVLLYRQEYQRVLKQFDGLLEEYESLFDQYVVLIKKYPGLMKKLIRETLALSPIQSWEDPSPSGVQSGTVSVPATTYYVLPDESVGIPSVIPEELSSEDRKIWESLNQKLQLINEREAKWIAQIDKANDELSEVYKGFNEGRYSRSQLKIYQSEYKRVATSRTANFGEEKVLLYNKYVALIKKYPKLAEKLIRKNDHQWIPAPVPPAPSMPIPEPASPEPPEPPMPEEIPELASPEPPEPPMPSEPIPPEPLPERVREPLPLPESPAELIPQDWVPPSQ